MGSTAGGTLVATVTEIAPNDGTNYDVSVAGMTSRGTIVATIPAGGAADAATNTNTASTSSDNSVTSDRVPTSTVALDNASPRTNDTLTATATRSDPDGDPVSLRYVWKVNGTTKQDVTKSTNTAADLTDTFDLSVAGNGNKGDTITVEVTPNDGLFDGSTASDTATVANSAPVASPQSVSTAEDVAKTITLTGTDADGDSLTFKVSTLPASGQLYDGTGTGGHHVVAGDLPYTVTDGAGKVTFDPTADFNGSDSFAFLANDGTVDSAGAATVSVTVTEVNDAPTRSMTARPSPRTTRSRPASWATTARARPTNPARRSRSRP